MNEQSDILSINYAPNPLKVRRRLNKLAVISMAGAFVCAIVPVMLTVAKALDALYSLELIVVPFIFELIIAGLALRQTRRNRDYQRGQSLPVVAILLAALAAVPSFFLSSTVQDRWGVDEPWAIDVLTVNHTWNPPSGARVVRTRSGSMTQYCWYELDMPLDSVASYQQAVIANKGPASSTATTVAAVRALQEQEDPDWWDLSAMPSAQAFTFSGHPTDVYVFSVKKGRVLVRQCNTDS